MLVITALVCGIYYVIRISIKSYKVFQVSLFFLFILSHGSIQAALDQRPPAGKEQIKIFIVKDFKVQHFKNKQPHACTKPLWLTISCRSTGFRSRNP
uniref:Uncharacterized protein n=1 Tax=Utricularia reniformis TaxID=192314 RepID=A0A1Y0B0E6_9LAMI|nr:hypothetical protein AEK19_MT0603 [Utricularia reniformis]ART30858.1 hypothetical protein AEK19_MT0603 [Utricularia reniformis]